MVGDGKKVESCVLLSSSSTFGGIWGAKEIWRLGICERSASVVGWLRGVGGEPRSLTAAGRNDNDCSGLVAYLFSPIYCLLQLQWYG